MFSVLSIIGTSPLGSMADPAPISRLFNGIHTAGHTNLGGVSPQYCYNRQESWCLLVPNLLHLRSSYVQTNLL